MLLNPLGGERPTQLLRTKRLFNERPFVETFTHVYLVKRHSRREKFKFRVDGRVTFDDDVLFVWQVRGMYPKEPA